MKKIISLLLCFFSSAVIFEVVGCSKEGDKKTIYEIDCEYYPDGSLSVKEEVTFSVPSDGLDGAIFNFFPLAMAEGAAITPLSADDEAGSVEILSLKVNGKKAAYEYVSNNSFSVAYGRSMQKDERVKIEISAFIKLPAGNGRTCVAERSVNLGNFYPVLAEYDGDGYVVCDYYPIGDPFYSGVADLKVRLTVPSTYVVAASAYATSLDVGESKTAYVYEVEKVRDFAFCLSEEYSVKEIKWGDRSIIIYYYSEIDADGALETARLALDYFSETFGRYPYCSYSISETKLSAAGMEYPLMCFIGDDVKGEDFTYTLVHEIAHQWWYAVVGNDQINESYLDESLAEYSTYLFFDEHEGYGIDGDGLIRDAASAANVCENAALKSDPDFPPCVKNSLKNFKTEYIYVNLVYNKGLIMMKACENAVGRAKMKRYLSSYYGKNLFSIADTDGFLSSLHEAAPIARSFIEGKTRVFI